MTVQRPEPALADSPPARVPVMDGYKERAKRFAHGALAPVVRALVTAGVRPDHLTILGLAFSMASAMNFALGQFREAAAIATLAGACDILDGEVARHGARSSRFGAFLDSTLDRMAEAFMLIGIAWFYVSNLVDQVGNPERVLANLRNGLEPVTWGVLGITAMLALVGSFMVSYTRARAEGLGLDCKVGWFERPERMVLLIVAGFFGLGPAMSVALILLTLLSFATAFQRMAHVWKITRSAGSDATEVRDP